MTYIGIDPSITSTGMCINGKLFNYCYEKSATTKKGDLSKWFELANEYITYRYHDQVSFNGYEDEQMSKISLYKQIVNSIITDIKENIEGDIHVAIEGYSYGSEAGNLIDLVQFGTLLRDSLLNLTSNIHIVSPNSLKLESCKLCYAPVERVTGIRKKKTLIEFRNNDGISGGKFTKKEMFKALIEKEDWGNFPEIVNWKNHLRSIHTDIGKNIPKPHEDTNDAVLLYMYIKNKGV